MKNKIIIKNASIKDYKKINQFHNNYYKTNRTLKHFLWLFRQTPKSKDFKNYYYACKGKKIIGILGFIKFNFVLKKKKFIVIKPEDLLMGVEAIKANVFEKINKKYERKISNLNVISILFSVVGWAFKKINYSSNFGNRLIVIKHQQPKSLASFMIEKKIPKFLAYFFSYILIYFFRIITFIKKTLTKRKLKFINYKEPPKWSNNINKSFINYWNFLTVDRNKDFLQWRVFDNPFINAEFTAFYYNKNPVGYIVYNKNMKNLYVADLIIVPPNNSISTKTIIDEILNYLDDYCIRNDLNYCKFELYLNNKLNNLLKNCLLKFGYISKKVETNFSFKIFNKKIKKKIISESYITNINKSGKWH